MTSSYLAFLSRRMLHNCVVLEGDVSAALNKLFSWRVSPSSDLILSASRAARCLSLLANMRRTNTTTEQRRSFVEMSKANSKLEKFIVTSVDVRKWRRTDEFIDGSWLA